MSTLIAHLRAAMRGALELLAMAAGVVLGMIVNLVGFLLMLWWLALAAAVVFLIYAVIVALLGL